MADEVDQVLRDLDDKDQGQREAEQGHMEAHESIHGVPPAEFSWGFDTIDRRLSRRVLSIYLFFSWDRWDGGGGEEADLPDFHPKPPLTY
jgi:hypothetical protein